MLILHVWFPSDREGGREGGGEGGRGRGERGRKLKQSSVNSFCTIVVRHSIKEGSRLKESRPSQSHALLRIRRIAE